MVATMISRNMVEVIDHSKIPNLSNIDPDPNFTDPAFNPGLKYGVPYMWGTIGIGYRKSAVETPTSWADIIDSDKYSGRIALLGNMRAGNGAAHKYLRSNKNHVNEKAVPWAGGPLIKTKKAEKTP